MHRRLAAAMTLSATLLLSACTNDAPQPPPPPSGGPTMPSVSPTSASQSTTPSASPSLDQEAADKAAVERAYRIQFAEFNRLEMAGGATRATQRLRDSASGQNLKHLLMWLKEDKETGQRQVNPARLTGVVGGPGTTKRRSVTACEDYSEVKWTRHGKSFDPPGSTKTVQRATVLKGTDGKWRVDLIASTPVHDFDKAICGGSR